MIDTVYLSQKAKDQLIKVKRSTGIQNWNILCRWAFCLSLKDETEPPTIDTSSEHAIEMTWKVFGGQDHDMYLSLLKERCKKAKLPVDKENMTQQLRAHLARGVGRLSEKNYVNTIGDLIKLA